MTVLYIAIVAELVDVSNISSVTFPDPNSNSNLDLKNSIFIPASYIKQRSIVTGNCNLYINVHTYLHT